jgi:hypothetical protein
MSVGLNLGVLLLNISSGVDLNCGHLGYVNIMRSVLWAHVVQSV